MAMPGEVMHGLMELDCARIEKWDYEHTFF